jgi:hypothetical protein
VLCLAGLALAAAARDDAWQRGEDNRSWRSECGACHLAFPPALLAGADWRAIMARLDAHFGSDASLAEPTRREIEAYLLRNSPERTGQADGQLPRITASDWFARRHRSALRLWRKGQLKSPADCATCHKGPDIDAMTSE